MLLREDKITQSRSEAKTQKRRLKQSPSASINNQGQKKMEIYVCTHKEFSPKVKDSRLTPLMVGAALREADFGYQRDDEGDNISTKNPNYCELTGLYWIWKNSREDTVGLCHYRRYFDPRVDYEKELKTHDVILPEPLYPIVPLRVQYCCFHVREDYMALCEAVGKVSPDYITAFDKVFDGNVFTPFNMFIGRRKFVDAYCSWLFSVLSEAEKSVKLSGYAYQQRVFGYMGERLMQVYVERNRLRVKRVQVSTPTEGIRGWRPWPRYFTNRLKFMLLRHFLKDYCK